MQCLVALHKHMQMQNMQPVLCTEYYPIQGSASDNPCSVLYNSVACRQCTWHAEDAVVFCAAVMRMEAHYGLTPVFYRCIFDVDNVLNSRNR